MPVTFNRRAQGVLRGLLLFACAWSAVPVLPAAAQTSVVNTVTVTNPDGVGCAAPVNGVCQVSSSDAETVNHPQLSLLKTASATSFTVGSAASYTLALTNNGSAATTSASTITDPVPAGLTIGVPPSGCTVSGQSVTCIVPTALAAGASASFVIPVTPQASAGASVTNTASVAGGGDATCPAQARCQSSLTTSINPAGAIDAIDDAGSTAAATAIVTDVLGNDTHPGGMLDPASVTVTTPSANGTTSINAATGAITFTPNAGFSGTSTYSYRVCLAAPDQASCDTAVVTVAVAPTVAASSDNYSSTPINNGTSTTTASVVANDQASGAAVVLSGAGTNAVLTPGAIPAPPAAGGINMDPATGQITIAAGTTPGTYTYPYTLCLAAPNQAVCDSTASATVVVTAAAVAYDFCPAGNDTPVFNIVNSGTGNARAVNIRRFDPATGNAVDVPDLATTAPGDTNGLMVDPVANRLLFLAPTSSTTSAVYAYDASNGGWYVAGSVPSNTLPRAGMNQSGVGYLITSGSAARIYTLTRNGLNYSSSAPIPMTYDVAPTDYGSGDIAFDAAGQGWLTAGQDLYKVNVTTGQAVRQTRPVLAGGTAPTVNWAGVAFTQSGQLVLADNTGSPAYYIYDRATGVITPSSASGGSRDLASCGFPVDAAPAFNVQKTLSLVNDVAYVAGSSVKPGDKLSYAIKVNNTGNAAGTLYPNDVVETLPANTTVVTQGNAFTCAAGSCPNTAATAVPAGGSATLNFIVTVNATLPANVTAIDNVVAVQQNGVNLCASAGNDCTETTPVRPTIDAVNDTPTSFGSGGGTVPNVVVNDTVNGTIPAQIGVNVSAPTLQNNGGLTGLVLNADGSMTVPANTAPGVYTATYQICTLPATTPTPTCDTATVVITVGGIDAVNDPAIAFGSAGGTVPSVLANDTVDGTDPARSGSNVSPPTLVDNGGLAGLVLNADGTLTVPANSAPGVYPVTYEICLLPATTPATCDQATVVITVAAIDAVNDPAVTFGSAGGTVPSVVTNDTVNGGTPAVIGTNVSAPTLQNNGGLSGLAFNPDGSLSVPPNAAPGNYTVTYQLCIVPATTPTPTCDTATVVITVAAIDAVNDPAVTFGVAGGTVPSVVANDTVNGGTPAVIGTNVSTPTITNNGGLAGLVVNPNGTLTVPANTAPGTYPVTYQICLLPATSPAICDTATVQITVNPVIVAVNDTPPAINGGSGGTTPSVLDNDLLNNQPVSLTTVALTPGASPQAGLTMNPDGTITVAPGTPGGTYSYPYTICQITAPTNCTTAIATVVVTAPIDAVNDNYPAVVGGGSTGSVLANDTLNGQPVVPSAITLTPGASPQAGITMNPDGIITVATGTPGGTYSFPYTICETANPANCDTAIATLVVAPPIVAVDDSFPEITTSGTTTSVLVNDTLNGQPVVPSAIALTPGTSPQASITMNPDGTITVAPGTPAGVYSYPYTICELASPTNCDTAVATVTVVATPIVSVDDAPPTINGEQGGTTPSVLGNDSMGGQAVDPSTIVLTPGASPLAGITMNPDGTITIAAGTPAGTYSYPYTICERADPTNCASAVATIVVAASYDIRLTKSVAVSTASIGDLVRYTLTIQNVGDSAFTGGSVLDTPPAGFSYVEGSLVAVDGDNAATVSGQRPIRIDGVDVAAGKRATFVYLMRVGAGVRRGTQVNQAQAFTAAGASVSNIATAAVTVQGDPLVDESLLFGTVYDDRDGDGWQDSAAITGLHVQGGFDPSAYVPNSTVMDAGNGWQPQADASAPLLHGIAAGGISARQSNADPAKAHQVVIRQVLSAPRFTDDFVLTTAQGVTVRMDAAGQTRVEKSGDAAKGLNAAEPTVERHVSQSAQGTVVDYVIRNAGIDERGIPGVRVASVDGMLIETDQFGRYHLEGVGSGDWARGRNFIFKVDPSTLPAGAVFTTANPLVRRITTGMPTRFDFGVKLPVEELKGTPQAVELELGRVLFAPGSAELKTQYLPAVERMAAKVEAFRGGEVIIAANGEEQVLAFDRANAVKAALLQSLAPDTAEALTISVRAEVQDPASLLAGLDAQGPLLGTVLFETDKATIKPQFDVLLDRVAAYLDQQGGGVITVVGHADRRGPAAYNADLGLRRAKAVYQAIAQRLPPEKRAKVRVDSSNDPAAPAGMAGQ